MFNYKNRNHDMNLTVSQILNFENQRYQAMIEKNLLALDKIFSDKLIYIHSNGMIDGKNSFIESIKSGVNNYLEMSNHGVEVRLFKEVGIITGNANFNVSVNGRAGLYKLKFHSIWELNEQPQFISWQATLATN